MKFVIAASIVGLSAVGFASPAQAAPDEPRNNVGYCVSDGFYGNQLNRDAEGDVVPSQSPGPKKTLPDGTVVEGHSIGDHNSGRVTGERGQHRAALPRRGRLSPASPSGLNQDRPVRSGSGVGRTGWPVGREGSPRS